MYGDNKTRDIDSEMLKRLIVAGSPVAKAAALTILDKRTGGKVTEVLKRILKEIGKEDLLLCVFRFQIDFGGG